ncbi:MAG: hypothetical protein ETSY2_18200 [Candidatus Entotheonella gemina]|uniref:Uncharacterized protein n=1 Tax=Candidatus Entotheonella gemina TaxID=1429439 RepID=W4M7T2_9BACT|nr:MAG: hypothetical protein ETSY2_18200 [Candidatus Entotheonella gemina]
MLRHSSAFLFCSFQKEQAKNMPSLMPPKNNCFIYVISYINEPVV